MFQNNPYNVLLETISFESVQQMGELITLKCLRGYCTYSRQNFEKLYTGYVKDLNRRNNPTHTFSDAYDLAQTAICFLCEFITDVYTVKNGKVITIKHATYTLVSRHVDRMRRHNKRACDIDYYAESLSVEIDYYEKKITRK
ncbi:MAG: hypothetical protein IKA57_00895 [Clostridia bacterium]|nr:hypothetical protein [Clostridia bacterium]